MSRLEVRGPRASSRRRPEVEPLERRAMLTGGIYTYHDDVTRSGWDLSEAILNPTNVTSATFGKLFVDNVDGKVDAEPLYVAGVTIPGRGAHNVLYVATENDSLYAFDADTGATLWKASMLRAGEVPSDPVYGSQVTPEIGITDTPVIDPTAGAMYLVAMSKSVSGSATVYHQRIHKISIATGADLVPPASIDQSITYPGSGPGGNGTSVIFDPKQYEERDALLLSGGVVYTGWASHSDVAPYTGWVIGFRASDLSLAAVLNIDPAGKPVSSFLDDGSGDSFWNSGGGPAADAFGNIYNLSANGPFDPALNAAGFPANGDFGDSILKMTPSANGLAVTDYFTPSDQQSLANGDVDLGSSGVMLIDVPGAGGAIEPLAVGSDKTGDIYVANRANMGKFNATSDHIYEELPGALGSGEFGSPARFGGLVYFGAVGEPLRAYAFNLAGVLVPTPVLQTANSFGYPGTTPAVSSYGLVNAVVWAAENGSNAVLHAYAATNLLDELYNSTMAPNGRDTFGTGNKFITPTVANGKVYVGTTNGVAAFGLLPTAPTFTQPARASANPVTGTSVILSALGADASYPESDLVYFWETLSAPAGAVSPAFSRNASNAAKTTVATFDKAGTYTFLVAATDPSYHTATSTTVVVVIQSPGAVLVTPASVTLLPGQAAQFAATVLDQFGSPFTVAVPIAWAIYPGGVGVVGGSGLYDSPSNATGGAFVLAAAGPALGAAHVTLSAAGRAAPAARPNQAMPAATPGIATSARAGRRF